MKLLDKAKRAITKLSGVKKEYDMSSAENRARQGIEDYENAKTSKDPITEKFKTLNDYYNNIHYTSNQIQELADKYGWDFGEDIPVLPEAFIHVETQIDDVVPTMQFNGRDDDLDSEKAKVREQVVDFILYNNHIDELNLDNERALNELGNAFWKVSFDGSIKGPGFIGEIIIGNPDPANMFPDPNAYEMDECEFVAYSYRMHKRKARREFGKIIDKLTSDNAARDDTEIYHNDHLDNIEIQLDDTVQVIEYWYRDDEGDIACSIVIDQTEVKHIPKYWKNTRFSGNQMFPFIKYGKIPMRKSFWDKGEIESIKPLNDAADREFITALLNNMFMSNDIVLMEDDALSEGQEPKSLPGAIWKTKPNKINAVKRLGGVTNSGNSIQMMEFIVAKIQETTGNFESAQGKEPVRVTTASGIAQLNERAQARKLVKQAGRIQGFRRLAELIDWTALEFYNTDRMILVRGKEQDEQNQTIAYNSDKMRNFDKQRYEQLMENAMQKGVEVPPEMEQDFADTSFYYPKVDIEISVGDGIKKSKAFTLSALQELSAIQITPQNAPIVKMIVEILDLPTKKEILEQIDMLTQQTQANGQAEGFEQAFAQLTPEEQEAFTNAPLEEQQAIMNEMMGGAMA
ncbi:MAG: hypothetical protein JM58_09500 [Peptococcaceae bacterium BICA1-8]|nr:MAG: hypothetical protein JM58_09500 [Peptococcaceae bacterium BICA1-8]